MPSAEKPSRSRRWDDPAEHDVETWRETVERDANQDAEAEELGLRVGVRSGDDTRIVPLAMRRPPWSR